MTKTTSDVDADRTAALERRYLIHFEEDTLPCAAGHDHGADSRQGGPQRHLRRHPPLLVGETNGYRQIATIGPLFLVQPGPDHPGHPRPGDFCPRHRPRHRRTALAGGPAGRRGTAGRDRGRHAHHDRSRLVRFPGKLGRPLRPDIVPRRDCRGCAAAYRGLAARGTQSRPALTGDAGTRPGC
jgi:hypothetical protein